MGQVPQVGQVAVHLDEVAQFGVGKASGPSSCRDMRRVIAISPSRFLARLFDDLAQKRAPVFQDFRRIHRCAGWSRGTGNAGGCRSHARRKGR